MFVVGRHDCRLEDIKHISRSLPVDDKIKASGEKVHLQVMVKYRLSGLNKHSHHQSILEKRRGFKKKATMIVPCVVYDIF